MDPYILSLLCIVLFALFLVLRKREHYQDSIPNACVDMMEKQASRDVVNACVQYSKKCDANTDGWHSPSTGAAISSLYLKYGIQPQNAITESQSAQMLYDLQNAAQNGLCVNPVQCTTNVDCPYPMGCSIDIGMCQ